MPVITDVSPTRLNTNVSGIGHSAVGRMLSIACTPDGQTLYTGSYSNVWESSDGGQNWEQLTWPQEFDHDDPAQTLAEEFGITSIPTMWLVDKKGGLRELNARENLPEKVEKLLAEK